MVQKQSMLQCLAPLIEEVYTLIESKINEKFDEACGKMLEKSNFENSTLSREELCDRWKCCDNTLRKWEREGLITALPKKGKRKIYSMTDILKAEMLDSVKGKINRAA